MGGLKYTYQAQPFSLFSIVIFRISVTQLAN